PRWMTFFAIDNLPLASDAMITLRDADRSCMTHETKTTKHRHVRYIHGINKHKKARRSTMRTGAIDQAAACIPTNWCDPMPTGKDGIGAHPYDCRQIAKLLLAIQNKIRALKDTGSPPRPPRN